MSRAKPVAAETSGGRPADRMNLVIPVLDGWGFLAERAKDPALSGIPVVLISRVVDKSPTLAAHRIGAAAPSSRRAKLAASPPLPPPRTPSEAALKGRRLIDGSSAQADAYKTASEHHLAGFIEKPIGRLRAPVHDRFGIANLFRVIDEARGG